jgi:hypothetical protein
MTNRNYIVGGFAALALIAVAACGSQGSPGTPYPAVAGVGAGAVATNGVTLTMPQSSGLGVGSADVSGTGSVSLTQSVANPSAVPVLEFKQRSVTGGARPDASSNTPVAYITVTASSAATISQVILNVAPTAPLPSGTYYLAFWNGSQWVTTGSAARVSSAGIITAVSGIFTPPISLAADASLYFVVYTGGVFVTPTPEPAAPVASPNPVTMSLLTTTTVYVATNAGLAVTASSSNTSIATVAASATAAPNGEAPFLVTAQGAGTTTLTFTDPIGQKTTDIVTVNDTLPSPVPSPQNFVIAAGDSTTISVSTVANLTITASSSNTAIATVTSSAQANSLGTATFTVTGVSSGLATITFSDTYGDEDTATVDVSPVKNGTFTAANGTGTLGAWTPCSYLRSTLTAAVNPSPPPEATGNQAPVSPQPGGTANATFAITSPANEVAVVTPPPNYNPTILSGAAPSVPSVIGNNVVVTGGSPAPSGVASSLTEGIGGICQTITLDSTNENLSFWVYEAGLYGPFYDADQEADILNSSGTALYSGTPSSILFAELNCFGYPGVLTESSYTSSKCIPAADGGTATSFYYQGGYWVQRGPYNISSYVPVGSSFTLFLGVWDWATKTYPNSYGNVMFVANVQMTNATTFPSSAPYDRRRSLTIALPKVRALAAKAVKSQP